MDIYGNESGTGVDMLTKNSVIAITAFNVE